MTADGWLDVKALLVPSDGSRLPGGQRRHDTRDRGSQLVFFDPGKGDNVTGEIYWWDGKRIVDSSGNAANAAEIQGAPSLLQVRLGAFGPALGGAVGHFLKLLFALGTAAWPRRRSPATAAGAQPACPEWERGGEH